MPSLTQKLIKKKQQEEFSRIVKEKLAEWDAKHEDEIDSLILWQLHEQFGFGKVRLKRFFHGFKRLYNELRQRYEMSDDDYIWLVTTKLKDIGVDVREWKNEEDV